MYVIQVNLYMHQVRAKFSGVLVESELDENQEGGKKRLEHTQSRSLKQF